MIAHSLAMRRLLPLVLFDLLLAENCTTQYIGCFPEQYVRKFGKPLVRMDTMSRFILHGPTNSSSFKETLIEADVSSGKYIPGSILDDYNFKDYKTVVLIHGWQILGRPTKEMINGKMTSTVKLGTWQLTLAHQLVAHEKVNVVVHDWRLGAVGGYSGAKRNTWIAGRELFLFLKTLIIKGLPLGNIHLVGHSLGAHIAGIAGHDLKMDFREKIGRISGLDPAGLMYNDVPGSLMINRHNAKLVDVYHTDIASEWLTPAGLSGQHGHADFYVNGGADQPGCQKYESVKMRELCDHKSVISYFTQSIRSPGYAIRCGSFADFKDGKCKSCGKRKCSLAGYNYKPHGNHNDGKMFYETTNESPTECAQTAVFHFIPFAVTGKKTRSTNIKIQPISVRQHKLTLKLYGSDGNAKNVTISDFLPKFNLSLSSKKKHIFVTPIPCESKIFPLEKVEIYFTDICGDHKKHNSTCRKSIFSIGRIKVTTINPSPYRATFRQSRLKTKLIFIPAKVKPNQGRV